VSKELHLPAESDSSIWTQPFCLELAISPCLFCKFLSKLTVYQFSALPLVVLDEQCENVCRQISFQSSESCYFHEQKQNCIVLNGGDDQDRGY
jgi:hypothetical protein